MRRDGIWRLHLGQIFDHGFFKTRFSSIELLALIAARLSASARASEHCGCIPPREYDGLWHTGQTAFVPRGIIGTGFRSLMRAPPELEPDGPLSSAHLLALSEFEQKPLAAPRTPNPILLMR
jgi:hypothetical protein